MCSRYWAGPDRRRSARRAAGSRFAFVAWEPGRADRNSRSLQCFVPGLTAALRLATILKPARLFLGSLLSDIDSIRGKRRRKPAGAVMDSQAFEKPDHCGGLSGLLAIVELFAAFAVICSSIAGTALKPAYPPSGAPSRLRSPDAIADV